MRRLTPLLIHGAGCDGGVVAFGASRHVATNARFVQCRRCFPSSGTVLLTQQPPGDDALLLCVAPAIFGTPIFEMPVGNGTLTPTAKSFSTLKVRAAPGTPPLLCSPCLCRQRRARAVERRRESAARGD